jgi:hypothetical protein
LATAGLIAGTIFAAPAASADQQFGCTSSTTSGLHMTATRISYGGFKSAIYASATQSYKQVKNNLPDVQWSFSRFTSSSGLQTRYSNPTQWGSSANPLDMNTRYVTAHWAGTSIGGTTGWITSCTTRVGAP